MRGADLSGLPLYRLDLSHARLADADLSNVRLRHAAHADLRRSRLAFAQLGGADLTQADLGGALLKSTDLTDADLTGAILRNANLVLGALFKEAADKIVLLLGRFTGEHGEALIALEEALQPLGYVPVRFDFEAAKERDTIETIATLAGLSRFIIADFSEARSAPLEAQRIIPDFAVPFVPIRHRESDAIVMFNALQKK